MGRVHVASPHRLVQWPVAFIVLSQGREQETQHLEVTLSGGQVKWPLAVCIFRLHLCPCCQELPHPAPEVQCKGRRPLRSLHFLSAPASSKMAKTSQRPLKTAVSKGV